MRGGGGGGGGGVGGGGDYVAKTAQYWNVYITANSRENESSHDDIKCNKTNFVIYNCKQ